MRRVCLKLAAPIPPPGPGVDGPPSPGACIVLTLPSEESGRHAAALATGGRSSAARAREAIGSIVNRAAQRVAISANRKYTWP